MQNRYSPHPFIIPDVHDDHLSYFVWQHVPVRLLSACFVFEVNLPILTILSLRTLTSCTIMAKLSTELQAIVATCAFPHYITLTRSVKT